MDSARTERTATRRLFARALLVLGGAATAWALGSATASADTGVDLARDFGVAIESAPLPASPMVAEGKATAVDAIAVDAIAVDAITVDAVDRTLTVLHVDEVEDGAKAALDKFDTVGESVAGHFRHATPGQRVESLLPDLPDLSPRPESAATDGPLAVAPELGKPVAVPAAERQRHGEPAPSAATPVDAEPFLTRRGPPASFGTSSSEFPGLPSGGTPLTLPAPAQSGHTGTGTGDSPQFGLLSTAPAATEPAVALTPRTARADVPAAVDAQPGVTPD